MQRVGINSGNIPLSQLSALIESAYRLVPGVDRRRHAVVQCARCLSYWLLDTQAEAIPCAQLNPYCDQVAYCPSCLANKEIPFIPESEMG